MDLRLKKFADETLSPHVRLEQLQFYINEARPTSIAPFLPLFLRLNGEPYSLNEHYQFEPMFATNLVKSMVGMFARQLGKTTNEGAMGVVHCATIGPRPFKVLYVTPLFDQVRRISNDHVRPFIETSPLRTSWVGTGEERSVLRRVFKNQAMMTFAYAFLSADRIRGTQADEILFDEAQDLNPDHLPVITSTMDASPYRLMRVFGTPKGSATALALCWGESSQAEWCVKCKACNHINIPSSEFDLDRMIGPYRVDISPARPGTVCSRCAKTIYPQEGRWWHRYPERALSNPGYHLPQPIAHIHYSNPNAWGTILDRREGGGNYTPTKYKNEVLAEEAGGGVELVTVQELQQAASLNWRNNPDKPELIAKQINHSDYDLIVVAADWGGGGQDGESRTVMSVIGKNRRGPLDVLWARRLPNPHDHMGEAQFLLSLYHLFGAKVVAHDYTGAGSLRDTFLVNSGISKDRIVGLNYVRAARSKIMRHIPPTEAHNRTHYNLDKARAMQHVMHSIKAQTLRFFKYDYESKENPGLLRDFLSLREIKNESAAGFETYSIGRQPGFSDDFAQSVMMGCATIWHTMSCWPRFSLPEHYNISPAQLQEDARVWEAGRDYSE